MNRSNLKTSSGKLLAAALIVFFISGSIPLKTKAQSERVLAQCAQEIFGINVSSLTGNISVDPSSILGGVPVKDEGVKGRIEQAEQKKCVDRLMDLAVTIARNILKKRILDTIVDQTINWIQGEGTPRFVTDFGGFIEDAADAAAGDVIQELGAGALCQPFRTRLLLQLQEPAPFSQQVSCTLSNVVDNIENFYDDFSQGGWIAYNEVIRPRNNYFGALILSLDEISTRRAAAQEAARTEAIAGQGFRSETECLQWTGMTPEGGEVVVEVDDDFPYRNPLVPPPTDGFRLDPGFPWRCTKQTVTTPGNVIAATTNQTLGLHSNFIINADDLTEYAAAIIDAGINRLIREGVGGLRRITTQATSRGFSSEEDLPGNLREAGRGYTSDSENQRLGQTRTSILNNLSDTLTRLEGARTNYQDVKEAFDELELLGGLFKTWCDNTTGGAQNRTLHPTTCESYTDATLTALNQRASSTKGLVDEKLEEIDPLMNRISALIPQIQNLNTSNADALATQATNLLQEASAIINDSVSLVEEIQTEVENTRALLSSCQSSTPSPGSCP
ncbi:MAG TPA: hypothetical protein VNK70_02045 [Candidatus Paceibacterota bacterium]|nr:hypothetical protein [Candidatus Paceibacterota bacterium]